MAKISNDFLVPNRRLGGCSGSPSIETRRLNMSVEENWYPLIGVIKIDKAKIKTAFPTITDAMLTKEFAFDFIKGGLPLVAGTGADVGSWVFDPVASLDNPIRIVSDNRLGDAAVRSRLLIDLVDDGVSYYINSQKQGRERISLMGRQAMFTMRTDLKLLAPVDYTKTAISADDLKKPYTVTADYAQVEGLPVRATTGYALGSKVTFKFVTAEGAQGWVAFPSTEKTSGWYIHSIPNTTIGANGLPLQTFDSVNLRYKEVPEVGAP